MACDQLKLHRDVRLDGGCMILSFNGWMDGGDVSTGTVDHLISELEAQHLAQIEPDDFYIYNFPASTEDVTLHRPHGRIEAGLVQAFRPPSNNFYCDEASGLVLFSGQEPNLRWREYAECIFELARRVGVTSIWFVGSVVGPVPHTREPRLFAAASAEYVKPQLESYGLSFTDYEGPVSIVTYLLSRADQQNLRMATLVAEIPRYVQGRNPRCIVAVLRKLSAIVGITLDLDQTGRLIGEWEKRINQAVLQQENLAGYIAKLEEDYDNEIFDTQMGDLKAWLEQKGIRVD